MKKETISFIPHPDKVLIKISQQELGELFHKTITRDDGTKVQLFTAIEEQEGYDKRHTQNVSCGKVMAVGRNVKNIIQGDIAILDYMVTNSPDDLVAMINGDKMIALDAVTTYHTEDALPSINMRKAHIKGDYDELSKLLGVVRNDRLISFDPYIFLNKEDRRIMKVSGGGLIHYEEPDLVKRTILAAPTGSIYKVGDVVIVPEAELFFRTIGNKSISVFYEKEIMAKV